MHCAYVDNIDPPNVNSILIRLIGEITYFSCDLLNLNDDEFNCLSFDNELIFHLQSTSSKQIYFCDYVNDKILLNSILPKNIESTFENPFIVKMMHSYTRQKTNDIFTTPSIIFTPMTGVVNNVKKVTLCIDVLLMTEGTTLGELTKIFIQCVNKQILDFKKSYAFHHSYLCEKNNITFIALHYLLDSRLLTLFVPEKYTDYERDLRHQLSKELMLEKTLERTQSLYPPKDVIDKMSCNGDKLINPHLYINTKFPDTHLVKGRYTYYHYLQDGIDDKGWGCAYRSLQTIVSWYVWQGWSTMAIPDHRQIQSSLVKLKDKEQSFIGSRSWIGSFEINLVLQDLLAVESRIISLTRGSDLESIYDQLSGHFDEFGAPVMIGGGQLAHTIIGVSRDKSAKVRFLVLDPHYKGSSKDQATVTGKGWCAWKELGFWKDDLPYNLCVPARPCL